MSERKAEAYFNRSLARARLADEEWTVLAQAAGFSVSDHASRTSIDEALSFAVGQRIAVARAPSVRDVIVRLRNIARRYRDSAAAGEGPSTALIAGEAQAGIAEAVESAGRMAIRLVAGPVRNAEMLGGASAKHEAAVSADEAENICSLRALPVLTRSGRSTRAEKSSSWSLCDAPMRGRSRRS